MLIGRIVIVLEGIIIFPSRVFLVTKEGLSHSEFLIISIENLRPSITVASYYKAISVLHSDNSVEKFQGPF